MRTAIYPGTFDPITYGHIDVIKKSLLIFDRIVVATTDNVDKNYHFSIEERIDIINNSLFKDLKLNKKKLKLFRLVILQLIFVKIISPMLLLEGYEQYLILNMNFNLLE